MRKDAVQAHARQVQDAVDSADVAVVSAPVSYLNALQPVLPASTPVSVSSPLASYLNAAPAPAPPDHFVVSPVVAYERQPGVSGNFSNPR
jgi:hypothetical protein